MTASRAPGMPARRPPRRAGGPVVQRPGDDEGRGGRRAASRSKQRLHGSLARAPQARGEAGGSLARRIGVEAGAGLGRAALRGWRRPAALPARPRTPRCRPARPLGQRLVGARGAPRAPPHRPMPADGLSSTSDATTSGCVERQPERDPCPEASSRRRGPGQAGRAQDPGQVRRLPLHRVRAGSAGRPSRRGPAGRP